RATTSRADGGGAAGWGVVPAGAMPMPKANAPPVTWPSTLDTARHVTVQMPFGSGASWSCRFTGWPATVGRGRRRVDARAQPVQPGRQVGGGWILGGELDLRWGVGGVKGLLGRGECLVDLLPFDGPHEMERIRTRSRWYERCLVAPRRTKPLFDVKRGLESQHAALLIAKDDFHLEGVPEIQDRLPLCVLEEYLNGVLEPHVCGLIGPSHGNLIRADLALFMGRDRLRDRQRESEHTHGC